MVVFTVGVIALIAAAKALPLRDEWPNMVTVPPNCLPGQVYWNGECRWPWLRHKFRVGHNDDNSAPFENSLWKPYPQNVEAVPQNAIQVPPNCKPGQQWINDACRDVWSNSMLPHNVVTVPPNCPVGQVLVNGQCRDLWFTPEQVKLWASLVDNYKSIKEMFAQRSIAEGYTNKKSIY